MLLASTAAFALAGGLPAHAQGENEAAVEAIIVTARKRSETDLAVPVAVTAYSQAELAQRGTSRIQDLATLSPSLTVSQSASAGGGAMYMRGIGTNTVQNSTFDQAVLLEVDGVPYSNGNLLRVGHYDLEQVEIIKGPQALFFGKNSPAGVVSMRSASPTDSLYISAKLSYEPYARERLGEAVISAPINEVLRGRLFVNATVREGSNKNLARLAIPVANAILPGFIVAPEHDRAFHLESRFIRATLAYEPNDRFSASAKVSFNRQLGDGVGGMKERYYCAQGVAQNLSAATAALGAGNPNIAALNSAISIDDCRLNGTVFYGGISPTNFRAPWLSDNDKKTSGILEQNIFTASLESEFKVADNLSLSSVTGLAQILARDLSQANYSVPATPSLVFSRRADIDQFSQELRLLSDFSSRVNFMVGGYYQKSKYRGSSATPSVAPYSRYIFDIPNTVESVFGQLTWSVTDQIELAGGARYSRETKSLRLFNQDPNPPFAFTRLPTANPRVTVEDVSPEATLTWRPSGRMTLYGAYKTGFKSGGYGQTLVGNAAPPPASFDAYYEPEQAKGFEFGFKSELVERTLRLDLNVYRYDYSDLQVNFVDTSSGTPVVRIANAAEAVVKGAEASATYYADAVAPGLVVRASANYNSAKYENFLSPCFIGQSIAEGCNLTPNAAGAFTVQDLSGRRLTNAPLWTGYLSATYTHELQNGLKVRVGADASYRSAFNPTPDLIPWGRQSPATIFGLQASVSDRRGAWEFAVIARNLGDVLRAQENSNVPLTGTGANTGTVRGGVLSRADLSGNTNEGRAVFLQLTVRPSEWSR